MPEWISAAAIWVGSRWWSGTTCNCVFEAPRIQPELLDLLSRQLDRCGPANLTVPRCGDPPPLPADRSGWALLAGVFLGFLLGFGAALLWAAAPPGEGAPAPRAGSPAPRFPAQPAAPEQT